MRSLLLGVIGLLPLGTVLAQASPEAGKVPGCPYQPGKGFFAEIQIVLSDRTLSADSATVKLDGVIPREGRVAGEGAEARYVVALPVLEVHLAKETIGHFSMAPSVVIENFNSAECHIRIEPGISSRSWANDARTTFSIQTTVLIGDRREVVRTKVLTACFDGDTPILLANGSRIAVEKLVPGDLIRNPMTNAAVRVEEVIRGTQADETMYRIGYGDSVVLFTAWHPVITRRGIESARDVMAQDSVLGDDKEYHRITVLDTRVGDPSHSIYNLRLATVSEAQPDHLLSAGGLVVGDLSLQNSLQPKHVSSQKSKRATTP